MSSTESCIVSLKHKHWVSCKSKYIVNLEAILGFVLKRIDIKMYPMIAVKSYILYTVQEHLFFISKQRITVKIISLLVLLVLNYTTKCLFLAFRFIFMYWEAAKRGNTLISSYSLFHFWAKYTLAAMWN